MCLLLTSSVVVLYKTWVYILSKFLLPYLFEKKHVLTSYIIRDHFFRFSEIGPDWSPFFDINWKWSSGSREWYHYYSPSLLTNIKFPIAASDSHILVPRYDH